MSCTSFTGPITFVYFRVQNGYVSHILLGSPSECFHEPCFKICQSVRRGTVSCRKGQIHEWSNRQQWTIARIRSFMKVQLHTAQLLPVSWEGEEKTTRRRFPTKIDQPQLIGWILSLNSMIRNLHLQIPCRPNFDVLMPMFDMGQPELYPKCPPGLVNCWASFFACRPGFPKDCHDKKTPCWISPLIADSWQLQAAPKASNKKTSPFFLGLMFTYIVLFLKHLVLVHDFLAKPIVTQKSWLWSWHLKAVMNLVEKKHRGTVPASFSEWGGLRFWERNSRKVWDKS